MGEKEITIKDVYLLMQQINISLSEKIEKVEQSTQSLYRAAQTEIKIVKEEVHELQEENKRLKTELEKLDRKKRQNNLVIYGINQGTDETQISLIENILEISRHKLEIELKESDINDIFRLGKKPGPKRPVLISLISHIKRQEILRKVKKLKNSGYFITEDLSESDLKERKILTEGLKEARDKNKKASIKGNKLIVEGEEYTTSDILQTKEIIIEDNYPPPQRRVTSEPSTPSPKEIDIEEEEHNIISHSPFSKESNKNEEKTASKQSKPQSENKKEELKLEVKTKSTSSSYSGTPKKATRSTTRPVIRK